MPQSLWQWLNRDKTWGARLLITIGWKGRTLRTLRTRLKRAHSAHSTWKGAFCWKGRTLRTRLEMAHSAEKGAFHNGAILEAPIFLTLTSDKETMLGETYSLLALFQVSHYDLYHSLPNIAWWTMELTSRLSFFSLVTFYANLKSGPGNVKNWNFIIYFLTIISLIFFWFYLVRSVLKVVWNEEINVMTNKIIK